MAKLTKRMRAIYEKIDSSKQYEIDDAIVLLKKIATAKFVESVDVAISLGIVARKSDQNIRGDVILPHGAGRSVRVAVFTQGANAQAAQAAGAELVGMDDLADHIKKGKFNFDVVIASPDAMCLVGQLGQILGPRGLMPNPKIGTVTYHVAEAIKNAKTGQIRYRNDKNGIIHAIIGKVDFNSSKLKENLEALLITLKKTKPTKSKGVYIKKITISTIMGAGTKDANCNTSTVNCNLLGGDFPSSGIPLQKCESTPNARDLAISGEPIAGVIDWEIPTATAYGKSVSLYEKHPVTGVPAGEPIADCFAVVARRDSAILCLADGVNWGPKASLAAKAAVHGCVDYLNQSVYNHRLANTTDAFVALLRSFHAAHNLILEENGMLTTLTAVLVLPLVAPSRYIACACNVGDSLAYVYSPKYGVREITQGSHDVHRMRDMRDALGALGPVDGTNPELANLTCAMTEVEPGDIVFITSDGVSDNLDPVVGKFTGLSGVEAEQRHRLGLLRTEDLLRHGVSGHGPPCVSARGLVDLMIDFVTRLTSAKRRLLEDADLYSGGGGEGQGRAKRKQMCGKLAAVPGKLDHATVVAFKVGEISD